MHPPSGKPIRDGYNLKVAFLADTPQGALRHNIELTPESVQAMDSTLIEKKIKKLSAMDAPENMETLHRLGELAAKRGV